MAEKKRCMCQLCGPTVHLKLCDNCRGKHSWWKAISQIILATIRECGGVKWRFHMQMCRWEGSGTLPNSYDPHSPALVCFTWDRKAQRDRRTLLGRRKEHWIKSSINHVKSRQQQILSYGKRLLLQIFHLSLSLFLSLALSLPTTGRPMFLKPNRHANKANHSLSIPANIIGSPPSGLASFILVIISLVSICYATVDNYSKKENSLQCVDKFINIIIHAFKCDVVQFVKS